MLPRVDRRELSLLADLERELQREPPAEVHELLAAHRNGASHGALVEQVRVQFQNDLPLRVLTLRWIDGAFGRNGDSTVQLKPGRATDRRSWVAAIEQQR